MTNPANGATLEDCHSNFFALVRKTLHFLIHLIPPCKQQHQLEEVTLPVNLRRLGRFPQHECLTQIYFLAELSHRFMLLEGSRIK